MKLKFKMVIIAAIGIFFATSAYTIAPLQLKTSLESFVFGFIEVPYNQAVQNKPFTVKLDTGSNNQLVNGSFDDQTEHKGWDEVSVGAWAKTDTGCLEGSCYEITTSTIGDAGTLQQTISVAEEYQYVGVVWAYRGATDGGEYEICAGSDCLTIGHEKGKWHPYQLYHFGANPIISVKPMDSFASGDTVDIKVDKARFGLSEGFQKVSDIGDWQDFTPTFENVTFGTGGLLEAKVRRVGDSAEFLITLTLGTGGDVTGSLLVVLPSDYPIDHNKLTSVGTTTTGYPHVGTAYGYNNTGNSYIGAALVEGQSNKLRAYSSDGSGATWATFAPFDWADADQFQMRITVPIQGWSSSTSTVVTQTQEETVETANRFEAYIDNAGTVSGENLDWINGDCSIAVIGSGDRYGATCTLNDLSITESLICSVTPNSSVVHGGYDKSVSTTSSALFTVRRSDNGTLVDFSGASVKCTKSKPDYNKTQVISGSFDAIKSVDAEETVETANVFSADVASDGTVSNENHDFINGNCSVTSGVFNCPFNSGVFTVAPKVTGCVATNAAGTSVAVCEKGVLSKDNAQIITEAGSSRANLAYTIEFTKNAPDYNKSIKGAIINTADNPRAVAEDQYSTTEMKWGKWNGEQLYRRCFTIDSDKTTTNTLLYTIDANLVPRNVPRYYNVPSSYALLSASYGTDSFLINYNPSTGEVKSYVTGNYIVKAGTSFCMDYTK